MGYDTDFEGQFDLDRPLSMKQVGILTKLHETRHDPDTMPSYYCQWIPNGDGDAIIWDDGEKFYEYVPWLKYIIDTYIIPWEYKLNGTVRWFGHNRHDVGEIVVRDNKIFLRHGIEKYGLEVEYRGDSNDS